MKQAGLPLLVKKAFDRVAGAALLASAAPIVAAAGIAVRLTMGGPVFFSQVRPGYKARPFRVFKMRTMTSERDANGELLPDAQRLTALGRFLRSTSIDELPQLYNVVRGELSLVGPRPLLIEYLPRYSPEQARRHDVLPGITGWAQVRERNAGTWDTKFGYDVWYVDHWSLALDVRILVETVYRVLKRDKISHAGFVTMPIFMGSQSTTNGHAQTKPVG
jgi:lipopolysaccharide/colanic/teichoic acid biosynthesis glycosyltransferase